MKRPRRNHAAAFKAKISPDLRAHSVSFFIEPLLKNHDPSIIETFDDRAQSFRIWRGH